MNKERPITFNSIKYGKIRLNSMNCKNKLKPKVLSDKDKLINEIFEYNQYFTHKQLIKVVDLLLINVYTHSEILDVLSVSKNFHKDGNFYKKDNWVYSLISGMYKYLYDGNNIKTIKYINISSVGKTFLRCFKSLGVIDDNCIVSNKLFLQ